MKNHKLLKIVVFISLCLLLAGIVFVKFDTADAAVFTDNYLRPILGNTFVGFMEKVYFNTTDKVQQITNRNYNGNMPQFGDQGIASSVSSPIPISGNLPKVAGEGVWQKRPLKLFPDRQVMAYTFVRPDPSRPYAYVTLLQMDINPLILGVVAGTKEPGGKLGNFGPGIIPDGVVKSGKLVAAFDGGFQYRDGMYGMIVGDKTYVPLENNVGTLVGYTDGSLKIVNYTGQDLGKDVTFIRQNCPILVENGQVFAQNEQNKKLWGRTFNADIFTWRSGIGLTKEGNLIYAVGNNLSPASLAEALRMAGATDAIQLDINPFWVRFNIFEPNGSGGYKASTLTKDLRDGSRAYLTGYSKDFFYVYSK
ncbi:MAG TPA: phosphodiester glycosidase family protein [Candidatus Saccharimonadales bacterium]|nr:phosphodiester glycosidase family protein [Candidatus Saccharimonadales bacterium]